MIKHDDNSIDYMLEQVLSAKETAAVLDEVLYDYATAKLREYQDGMQERYCTNMWVLKELRDRILLKADNFGA